MGLWVGVQGGLPPLGFALQGALPHQSTLAQLSSREGSQAWQTPLQPLEPLQLSPGTP